MERLGGVLCRQLGVYCVPNDFLLSVVIPVYNESRTLAETLRRVLSVPVRKELIVVDDASTDGTTQFLRRYAEEFRADDLNSLTVYYHLRNQGKGRALRTGFEHVNGNAVIIQDADLEYDPAEFPLLLRPIVEGLADVVYGSRFLGNRSHRVLYFWHYVGNKVLTTLSNCFTDLNLTDMETCYKVFRGEVIREILPTLRQNRFGFEPEITAKISRRRARVYEIGISYDGRTYEEGKKIGWKDGVHALWCIVRYGLCD